MEVSPCFSTSFSSLPTTSPSSSPPSSSASLDASLLLEFADDLWFYKSVVSVPSLSVPRLPSLFSSSPDSSTLIAQCMITDFSPTSQQSLVSSSSSASSNSLAPDSTPPAEPHPSRILTAYDSLPAPPSIHEIYANTFSEYDEIPYGVDYASSTSDRDEDMYRGFMGGGEDEEAYYYYTATSDLDDEDTHHGYHVASDGEDEESVRAIKLEVPPADVRGRYPHEELDDAISGIYDVGAFLKDQHHRRTGKVSHAHARRDAASRGFYLLRNHARSNSEQKELKENLKLWARGVVSTLATKGRPLL